MRELDLVLLTVQRFQFVTQKGQKEIKYLEIYYFWDKSSVAWYFGFKLHIIINERGELLAFQVTPGNTDDRVPVPTLTDKLWGSLFGDKGYISKKLWQELWSKNIKLIPLRGSQKSKVKKLEI